MRFIDASFKGGLSEPNHRDSDRTVKCGERRAETNPTGNQSDPGDFQDDIDDMARATSAWVRCASRFSTKSGGGIIEMGKGSRNPLIMIPSASNWEEQSSEWESLNALLILMGSKVTCPCSVGILVIHRAYLYILSVD